MEFRYGGDSSIFTKQKANTNSESRAPNNYAGRCHCLRRTWNDHHHSYFLCSGVTASLSFSCVLRWLPRNNLWTERKWKRASDVSMMSYGKCLTTPPVPLTGDGQGEVLADDRLLSFSSGNSTDDIRMVRAASSLRLCTGLDGASNFKISNGIRERKVDCWNYVVDFFFAGSFSKLNNVIEFIRMAAKWNSVSDVSFISD